MISRAAAQRLFYRQRRWITSGAITLAAVAGFVDVVVLTRAGLGVSHMSGDVARVAEGAARGDTLDLGRVAAVIAAFVVGAMVSGALIGTSRVLPGRRYGATLLVESAALAGAAALFGHGWAAVAVPLAAFACGLQNGIANGFYGVVLRTTHLTGILTDLGVTLGHRVRGTPVAWWRVGLLGGIVAGFVTGGIGGALASAAVGFTALLLPAAACLAGGLAYSAWLWHQHPVRHPETHAHARFAELHGQPHVEAELHERADGLRRA